MTPSTESRSGRPASRRMALRLQPPGASIPGGCSVTHIYHGEAYRYERRTKTSRAGQPHLTCRGYRSRSCAVPVYLLEGMGGLCARSGRSPATTTDCRYQLPPPEGGGVPGRFQQAVARRSGAGTEDRPRIRPGGNGFWLARFAEDTEPIPIRKRPGPQVRPRPFSIYLSCDFTPG